MEDGAEGRVTRFSGPSPYKKWEEQEGIPIHRGSYIESLYEADVQPWARSGQKAAFVNLADQEKDDGWLVEIAPGGQTEPMHHLFEATIYVVTGRGATTFWQGDQPKQTVEWQRGSLFSPPLNCYYQHFNLDGNQPARLFSVTSCPIMINLTRDPEFVFNDTYAFSNRYKGEEDYFSNPGRMEGGEWHTNFVPDLRAFELRASANRGVGAMALGFALAHNQMACHISQWPSGTYKKAHCHGVGAHVTIIGGQGYSLLWMPGEERRKVPWHDGSVLSPMAGEYHQHFATGRDPARFVALRLGALDLERHERKVTEFNPLHWAGNPQSIGGIPYEEEDPAIYAEYAAECAANGVEVRLPKPQYVTA
jgi:hypothetical protein